MAITLTLTEGQYHVLSQALSFRERHLEAIAYSNPPMASALPTVREIHQMANDGYAAHCVNRRKYLPAPAEAIREEVERLRAVIERDAVRFDHCALMIAQGFNASGTLRAERQEKAQHYALEALAALRSPGHDGEEAAQ